MTFDEAQAALKLAPSDSRPSAAFLNCTRRQAVRILQQDLEAMHPCIIDITPQFAYDIAKVVQDTMFPVPLHFAYDKHGNISVGWNREQAQQKDKTKDLKDAWDVNDKLDWQAKHPILMVNPVPHQPDPAVLELQRQLQEAKAKQLMQQQMLKVLTGQQAAKVKGPERDLNDSKDSNDNTKKTSPAKPAANPYSRKFHLPPKT